jgi:hypothetical protein
MSGKIGSVWVSVPELWYRLLAPPLQRKGKG